MPSLLGRAAMAALAGSGGRKLGDSTVGPCTHDICGRRLLTRESDHGSPVFQDDYAAGTGLTHGDVFYGYGKTSASIVGDKVKVTAQMTNNYNHADRDCTLTVTPTILTDDSTSATFNPAVSGNKIYASVQEQSSDNYADGKIEVELADPTLDGISLGYLGVDVAIRLNCNDDDMVPGIFHIDGVKVQHTFREHDSLHLDIVGGVDSLATQSTFPLGGNKMSVTASGQATRSIETGAGGAKKVRFPEGQWTDFGRTNLVAADKYPRCRLDHAVAQGFNLAGWYDQPSGDASQAGDYTVEDTGCTGVAGSRVCDGRKYTADISFTSKVGYEIPLAKYFSTAPTIKCNDDGDTANDETEPITLATDNGDGTATCDSSSCSLAEVSLGLEFTKENLSTGDYGDDITTWPAKAFGDGQFFTVAQEQAKFAWADLEHTFDYTFTIASKNYQCETFACSNDWSNSGTQSDAGAITGGTTETLIAGGRQNAAAVQDKLDQIVSGIIANTDIPRPTKYGETRSDYAVGGVGGATNDIAVRRASGNIRVNLEAAALPDGTVTYKEDAKDDTIGFDGPEIAWLDFSGTAALASGDHPGAKATAKDSVLLAAATVDDYAAEKPVFTFFKAQGVVTDAVLFDQGIDASCAAGAGRWCKSEDGGDKWLCSKQEATFEVSVGKNSKDDRQTDTKTVSKKYSVDASEPNVPAAPTISWGGAATVHQLSGADLPASYPGTPASVNMGTAFYQLRLNWRSKRQNACTIAMRIRSRLCTKQVTTRRARLLQLWSKSNTKCRTASCTARLRCKWAAPLRRKFLSPNTRCKKKWTLRSKCSQAPSPTA